jgi:glutamate-1-semialdehyde 2,1-aminomutase
MQLVAPSGPVYQAGTLSGNPLAMAAGIATLKKVMEPGFYENLDLKMQRLTAGMHEACRHSPVPVYFKSIGAKFGLFFTAEEVHNYAGAKKADTKAYARFFWRMIEQGIYLAPSQFEAGFLSSAHTDEQLDLTIKAARESFASLLDQPAI